MRQKIIGAFLAVAGTLGTIAVGRYMIEAPTTAARILGTASILVFLIGVAYAVFPRRQGRGIAVTQYLIVGVVFGVLAVGAWWALGFVPVEAKAPPPDLTAKVQADGDDYFLVVENRGGQAVIWADVKVQSRANFDGVSDQRIYPGYWEGSKSETTTLRSRQRDRLVLGGVRDSSILIGTAGGALDRRRLLFVFHDPGADNGRGILAQDWAPNKTPQTPEPFLVMGVTLHTDPLLPYEASGIYEIAVSGLYEQQSMSTTAPK